VLRVAERQIGLRRRPVVDTFIEQRIEGFDDPAVILWTSGTTSEPRGVIHTHQSLRVEADTIAAAHDMRAGESLLLPMPVTHVAGLTYGILLPVTNAITTVLMDTWEPGRALRLVERESIAVMISTPVFMRTMIDHPEFDGTDRTSVRMFSLGGAGVAPAMVREGACGLSTPVLPGIAPGSGPGPAGTDGVCRTAGWRVGAQEGPHGHHSPGRERLERPPCGHGPAGGAGSCRDGDNHHAPTGGHAARAARGDATRPR
jgi:hypothetical protein